MRELEKVKRDIIEWNEEFVARKGRAPNNKEKEDIKGLYEEFRTRTLKVLTRETRVSEMKVELQPFDVQAFSWLSEMPVRPKTEAPRLDKLGDPVGHPAEEEKLEGLVGERGAEQEQLVRLQKENNFLREQARRGSAGPSEEDPALTHLRIENTQLRDELSDLRS